MQENKAERIRAPGEKTEANIRNWEVNLALKETYNRNWKNHFQGLSPPTNHVIPKEANPANAWRKRNSLRFRRKSVGLHRLARETKPSKPA